MEHSREQDNGWRSKYKIHPATELFPLMSQGELTALVSDIGSNGLKIPIQMRIVEGEEYLIDGRNRLNALQSLSKAIDENMIERKEATLEEVVRDVVSLNINRRHLNSTQRGVIGEAMWHLIRGSNRYQTKVDGSADPSTFTRVQVSKTVGVGEATIGRIRRVRREAPDLLKPMQEGVLSAEGAITLIQKRRLKELKVPAASQKPTIMVHENICSADRIMSQPLERIYNSISHHKWGLFHFLIQLEKELGRDRLRRIAVRAERARLSEERIKEKILAAAH